MFYNYNGYTVILDSDNWTYTMELTNTINYLKKNKDNTWINWHNFNKNDTLYGHYIDYKYKVNNIDHVNKIVTLIPKY